MVVGSVILSGKWISLTFPMPLFRDDHGYVKRKRKVLRKFTENYFQHNTSEFF